MLPGILRVYQGTARGRDLMVAWREQVATIQEGVRRSKAEGVLAILDARQLTISPVQRAQVLACKDIAQLDRWLRQAVTAAESIQSARRSVLLHA
jgi:hypothetical protein